MGTDEKIVENFSSVFMFVSIKKFIDYDDKGQVLRFNFQGRAV